MAASVASGAGSKACVGAPGSAAAAAGVVLVSSPAVAGRLPPFTAIVGIAEHRSSIAELSPR